MLNIWPWKEINRLKNELHTAEIRLQGLRNSQTMAQFWRAQWLNARLTLRGANKGITRLRRKLDKFTKPKRGLIQVDRGNT